jgi:hypothetical protein
MALSKLRKRRLAALKGWKTRERNKRSEAAKKGWKKRRAKKRQITPTPRPRREEYVLRFSYHLKRDKKRGQLEQQIKVEIHATGPAKSKRETVIMAARSVFGAPSRTFKVEIVAWSKEYLATGRVTTYRESSSFNNSLVRTTVERGNAKFRDRSDTEL